MNAAERRIMLHLLKERREQERREEQEREEGDKK